MNGHRVLSLALGLLLMVGVSRTAAAIEVQRVVSPGGIEAWLVEDHKIPVLALAFQFRGGAALDPPGKEGLATLTASLLDEGAGEFDSQAFHRALEDRAIQFQASASRDSIEGSLRTLARDRDQALQLLGLALTKPHFEPADVARVRDSIIADLRQDESDPETLARRTLDRVLFPHHPYGQPLEGTEASVAGLTENDLHAFAQTAFTRDRLLVTVAGDITPADLGPALDQVFGPLPAASAAPPVAKTSPAGAGTTTVLNRPTAQSVVLVASEGLARTHPDWFAASLLNRILGGSGFDARLMSEIRVKRGLSYGIYSYLIPLDGAATLTAGGNTANANAGAMLTLVKEEWHKLRQQGVTAEELAQAKTWMTGSLPLQFTSTTAIARTLLEVRRYGLGLDYLDHRSDLINAVTLADVKRVAERLLEPERLAVVVVGQPVGITASATPAAATPAVNPPAP